MDALSVVATVVGVTSLFALYKLISKIIYEVNNKRVLKNIIDRDRVRQEVLDHTSADSVAFFKTHNKEGRPSHLKDYKTTCVRGTKEEENRYRDLVVDENYVSILLTLMDSNKLYYSFRTEDERPCLLKTIFETEGIHRSAIYYIESVNSGIFYVIFSKYSDTEFSDGDLFKFKEAVNKIRSLRNIYYRF